MRSFLEVYYDNCPDEYSQLGRWGHRKWKDVKNERVLTEGLITSYPISNVIVMLDREYGELITHMQADVILSDKSAGKSSGVSIYVKSSVVNEDFIKKLTEKLQVYGYFIALKEPYNAKEYGFFIEPKFPFKLEMKYLKNTQCWHVTHKRYLDKIMKIGLVPRNSETHFNHDGNRIYLFFTNSQLQVKGLKNTLSKSKNVPPSDMIALKIDIPENIDIYIDPSFGDDMNFTGAFTFSNISPTNITPIQ